MKLEDQITKENQVLITMVVTQEFLNENPQYTHKENGDPLEEDEIQVRVGDTVTGVLDFRAAINLLAKHIVRLERLCSLLYKVKPTEMTTPASEKAALELDQMIKFGTK